MKFTTIIKLLILMLGLPLWSATASDTTTIIAFGDSLVAGYGLPATESFPSQLQGTLAKEGYQVNVINAGVSGETSAGGRARIEWLLKQKPDIVILVLGANDVLRGISPYVTRANLEEILKRLREQQIEVIIGGMKAPPNLGMKFQAEFDKIYPDLATQYGAALYPFFLEKVYNEASLNLEDGIHPNLEGINLIVSDILPYIKMVIQKRKG